MLKRLAVVVSACSAIFLGLPSVRAAVHTYTEQEIVCAATIGVDLRVGADPYSSAFVRRLAWVSDHVVYGEVKEILHDLRGPYATNVKLQIFSAMKGTLVQGDIVYIAIFSGPVFLEPQNRIVDKTTSHEPSFVVGEKVLVFLNSSYVELPDNPDAEKLRPGQYRLSNNAKWNLKDRKVTLDGLPSPTYSIGLVQQEVALTTQTQQANCR